MLQDETNVINLFEEQSTFYSLKDEFFRLQDSAWDKFPTPENPYTKYKYVSMDFQLDKNL